MGRPRAELQTLLEGILGSSNVYFQPPATVKMQYPCIVYNRDYATPEFADNQPYRNTKRYQVMVIDQNPDSAFPDLVAALPLCAYNRFLATEDLNHDIYYLYF